MARQKTITIDPVDVDADGIAEAQAVAAAGNLALDGALIVGGVYVADYPRKIGITSDGDDSARTFTVTGTDPDGKAQAEAVPGPNATTTESAKYWATITQIAVDDACAGNISSGTVDELVTKTYPLNKYYGDAATVSVESITDTISLTIEETFSDIQNESVYEWYSIETFVSATRSEATTHATGVRFKVNSYTSGADFKGVIVQNG